MSGTNLTQVKKAVAKKTSPISVRGAVNIPSDFHLVTQYLGYRNKEDSTNLPAGYLVSGSQNILTTTGGRFGPRMGYVLDGQSDMTVSGVKSSFDWDRSSGNQVNLRYANGKLQYRYVASVGDVWSGNTFTAGQIYWIDLMTSLTASNINFADFWDFTTEKISLLLFVMGSSNIYDWTGMITTLASATANTITKTGTSTWGEIGALKNGTRSVVINGSTYIYTGGEGTTTLTGVSPSPIAEPTNSVIHQSVRTNANSASVASSLPSTFTNNLISILRNQVYIGSLISRSVYISKTNSYTDYQFTAPVRVVGEGAIITLDGSAVALVAQEDTMYVSAGKDFWYQTKFTLSSDLTKEDFSIIRLKTSARQATQSQTLTAKNKNSIVFVSNETTFDELGRLVNNFNTPLSQNISDPIKNDFDTYDFTDGQVVYFRNFIFISVPKSGLIRVYNIVKGYWEAPQILPVARFSIINGVLYGHDYNTPNTYQLFTGHNDNGNPIEAKAYFSFQNYGTRSQTKDFNEFYVEGYISSNSIITHGVSFEIDGFQTASSFDLSGTSTLAASFGGGSGSLGKASLGKNPIGGINPLTSDTNSLPPKYRVIFTLQRLSFYECQFFFTSSGIDFQWEILAFGGLARRTEYGNNSIKI